MKKDRSSLVNLVTGIGLVTASPFIIATGLDYLIDGHTPQGIAMGFLGYLSIATGIAGVDGRFDNYKKEDENIHKNYDYE